ncbi:MAG: hypothetical protein GOV02_03140 [Candidatus Aenigmarchaeota archaeon]|nr:hypothetical protein [Candidatus Aenigmarchaeota archaeon]
MGEMIEFPNANEEQNKILNKIAEQKAKESKAKNDEFDKEKDREEFLYLWKHFEARLNKYLKDYKEDLQPKGYHGLEVLIRIKKDDSSDELKEKFIFSDKLKLFKITEIE